MSPVNFMSVVLMAEIGLILWCLAPYCQFLSGFHLNQSLNEDDINIEKEVIEEIESKHHEFYQDKLTEQLGGYSSTEYTSKSESDHELEILELEKEGPNEMVMSMFKKKLTVTFLRVMKLN